MNYFMLTKPVDTSNSMDVKKSRTEWEKQFEATIHEDVNMKENMLEGGNEFDESEWVW